MVLVAPRSAKLIGRYGSRVTLLIGYALIFLGFVEMLLLWHPGSAYWEVGLGYALTGAGVGFAGTPASHSLTGSVPVRRAGMASATADLQRDLGGAIMVSVFGALLTAGYGSAASAAISAAGKKPEIAGWVQTQLTKSYAGAQEIAQEYPKYAGEITAGARQAFLDGAQWAYAAGIVAVLIGTGLVFFLFPLRERELQLLNGYHEQDDEA